jgi:hypothetical protein
MGDDAPELFEDISPATQRHQQSRSHTAFPRRGHDAVPILKRSQFDETRRRDGRGRAVKKERGDWVEWKDALKEINLNLQSDLMEGILKRNSGRELGMTRNDVLPATEGNTESRDGGGECDWGKGRWIERSRDLGNDRFTQDRQTGNESGAASSPGGRRDSNRTAHQHSASTLKTQAWNIPHIPSALLRIRKHTKNLHASVIGLTSRLVTCRLRPHLPGVHLSSLAIAATSPRCLNRNRRVALYCTAHHHGNSAAACAGHKEAVGSWRDNVYVLPSPSMALYSLVVCAPSRC